MSITRKFVTAIVGAIAAGLAAIALALLPGAGTAESPEYTPETGTEIADSPGDDQITSDFPWN
jgi:hypothetical protein